MSVADGISFASLDGPTRYKLLCATVVPRPIALVTTLSEHGIVNAAPFSFFNVFSETPPLVVLGLQHKPDGTLKDTARNIARTGEFVVNVVDEALAEGMNVCAVDFPPDASEPDAAGLAVRSGAAVAVPHLAAAPFALECRRHASLVFGPGREILIGEVLHLHARPGLLDPKTLRVDEDAFRPVGRLFGAGYARQNDRFALARESWADWSARRDDGTADQAKASVP